MAFADAKIMKKIDFEKFLSYFYKKNPHIFTDADFKKYILNIYGISGKFQPAR